MADSVSEERWEVMPLLSQNLSFWKIFFVVILEGVRRGYVCLLRGRRMGSERVFRWESLVRRDFRFFRLFISWLRLFCR